MADSATEIKIDSRPFQPSWIDRFNQWVEELPVRAWIFYVVFGIALVLIQILFLWLESGLQAEELVPVIIFNGLVISFILALIHLLDDQAVTALDTMRPTLELTEPEFERYQYQLANMPAPQSLIAGLILLLSLILMERLWITPIRYASLGQLPIFAIVFHIIDKSSAFLYGAFFYHTIRQLRLVNTINRNHIRINLFNIRPLQAFSGLTASTAVGLLIGVYVWILINPELLTDPITLGFSGLITVAAIVVFIWPLYGVHRLMELEKGRALHDSDLRFEAVFSKFNQLFQDDDYPAIEKLNGTIASLEIQQKRIESIPTWPWRPETARFVITAVATPLIAMIIQFFVLQAFDR